MQGAVKASSEESVKRSAGPEVIEERNRADCSFTFHALNCAPLGEKVCLSSSKQWLARHLVTIPTSRQRLSHPASYRSRSAFKLLEIDDPLPVVLLRARTSARWRSRRRAGGLEPGRCRGFMGSRGWTWGHGARVRRRKDQPHGDGRWGLRADARSGLWSDRAERVEEEIESGSGNEEVGGRGVVVAIDRLRIPPIPGVHTLQADFLVPETALMLEAIIWAKANPDGKMAANATGNRTRDTGFTSTFVSPSCCPLSHRQTRRESWANNTGLKHFDHPRVATNFVPFTSTHPLQRHVYQTRLQQGCLQGGFIGYVSASKVLRRQLG